MVVQLMSKALSLLTCLNIMYFALQITIFPRIIWPSHIVTYLKVEHNFIISFQSPLLDKNVSQFHPPRTLLACIPKQVLDLRGDENSDFCCFYHETLYRLPKFLANLLTMSSLMS